MRHSPSSSRQPLVMEYVCALSGMKRPLPPVNNAVKRNVARSDFMSISTGPVVTPIVELPSTCARIRLCNAARSIPSFPTKSAATPSMKSPALRSVAAVCMRCNCARSAVSGVSRAQAANAARASSNKPARTGRLKIRSLGSNIFAFSIRGGMLVSWNPTNDTCSSHVPDQTRPWGGSER